MKQLLFPVKVIPRILTALLIAITVTGCSAQVDRSKVLLLPTVAVGASYNRHEGQIQETNGNVLNVNRSSRYAGLGSGAVGAGTIQVPGVSLIVDLEDAERAAVEELLRERELQKAREAFQVQSVRLAELLHLDAKIQLDPSDKDVVPIHIVPADRSLSDLIDAALLNHPEVKQRQALADRAFERFRKIKHGPLIPKIALNFSTGNLGGDSSHSIA